MELTKQQQLLFDFVKEQHKDQKRKYTNEPYWTHLYNVSKILYDAGYPHLIEIALCHDLIEDTSCTYDQFRVKLYNIGFIPSKIEFIYLGVIHLTDFFTKENFPHLNRKKRKEEERIRLHNIPFYCQTVKYADMIDNCSSIIKHDPSFAKIYLEEKEKLLKVMNDGDIRLYKRILDIVKNGK